MVAQLSSSLLALSAESVKYLCPLSSSIAYFLLLIIIPSNSSSSILHVSYVGSFLLQWIKEAW